MSLDAVSDEELLKSLPRGVRNRNPGNIEDGDFARSLPGYKGSDGRFAIFDSMDNGVGAQSRLLGSYGKRGINTVEGVVNRWAPKTENDTGAYVNFVAQKLGVDPRAPLNMDDPATLEAMSDAMAEHENGVPVRAPSLSAVSDEELLASLGDQAPPRKPAPTTPAAMAAAAPKRPVAAPRETPAQLAASGFMQPFRDLGDMMSAQGDKLKARAMNPPKFSLTDLAAGTFENIGDAGRLIGGVMGLASAPAQAVVRPAADAIQRTMGDPTKAPQLMVRDGKLTATAPRKLTGVEGRADLEGALNNALSAARPATAKAILPRVQPRALAEMDKAQGDAWKAVDASGYRFPKKDLQAASSDINRIVMDADPDLYPEAAKIAAKVERLAGRGELTPAQANRLRSQIGEKLLAPGSTEVSVGNEIKGRIDALIDSGNAPELKEARRLYTQYKKMDEVSRRIESGELAQETAGTGGNQNAVRQKLRPLIDPKSPQRLRNATKEEAAAIRKVTKGTTAQNALRLLTAFDPTAGKLQAMLSGPLAFGSGGTSLAMMPVGMAAKAGEKAIAAKNLQSLLDLISIGGSVPRVPAPSVAGPFAPLTGPSRLLGAGVVGAPLARIPAEQQRSKSTAKAATKARRR